MWFWNYFNYNGEKYVEYEQKVRLDKYKENKGKLWEDVRTNLYDYWL
jgi:hypothetical protein